ncbi:unnamed protein product [Larinioides sclopetarius]|uniref:Uncharacterized protein n=1 Tax=Larinioides sclopetarius TaxID=280406 RepID=A0AAV1ZL30_9ARAC
MTQVRRRYVPKSDYDERLPFGGKVVLAKKKKPQSWFITFLEELVLREIIQLHFSGSGKLPIKAILIQLII